MGRHHSRSSNRDRSDKDENYQRHHKKHKKKSSKRRRHYDEDDDSLSSSASVSMSGSDDDADESSRRHRRSRRKSLHKKDRSSHKKSSHHKHRRQDDDWEREHDDDPLDTYDPRAVRLSEALLVLLQSHPDMASELPIMLVRMGSGTSFDLSHVQIPLLRQQLSDVFVCLSFAEVQLDDTGSWIWSHSNKKTSRSGDDLTLLKVVNSLLESLGFSIKKIKRFDQNQIDKNQSEKQGANVPDSGSAYPETKSEADKIKFRKNSTQALKSIISLFQKYGSMGLTPAEVLDMLKLIIDGKGVVGENIENNELKNDLKALFLTCNIKEEETEDGDVGFSLPERNDMLFDGAYDRIQTLIEACVTLENTSNNGALNIPKIFDMIPTFGPQKLSSIDKISMPTNDESDSDSDIEGPLLNNGRNTSIDKEQLIALANMRQKELDQALGRVSNHIDSAPGVREEWMTTPGEHDFLSTISSEKAQMKSRAFKNERVRGQAATVPAPQINPMLQSEMENLVAKHAAARGPALIDMHREKKKKENDEKTDEWKWNRNNDLDHGRRVDKNALHMIMGGASDNLKEKFQGSVSRSFM